MSVPPGVPSLRQKPVRRYTDQDQQQLYSGDLGLEYVAGLQDKDIPWGQQAKTTGGVGSGGGGTPLPAPPSPAPAAPVNLQPILDALAALAVKVDAVAGVAVEARDAAKSAEHDAFELNKARMEAPPVPVLSVPCLVGRVPRALGGSSEVRFCPVPQ